jgi:hypothetical protein
MNARLDEFVGLKYRGQPGNAEPAAAQRVGWARPAWAAFG